MTTPRCFDFPGPPYLAVATSDGWIPFNEHAARLMAINATMLGWSPEHRERLRADGTMDAIEAECAQLKAAAIAAGPTM